MIDSARLKQSGEQVMNTELMFSSKTDQHSTPQDFFDKLDDVFNFKTDVCADAINAKCDYYYGEDCDGLTQSWIGSCWMNPPYGRQIGKWVKKAYESARDNNATVVCLLPARTDTKWFQDYCLDAEHFFVRGRLKFGDAVNSAPFPSVVVVFRPTLEGILK